MSALQSFANQLGLPPLDFDIDENSRGKIMRASILPAIVLAAQLAALVLELYYSGSELRSPGGFGGAAPEIWQRIYTFVVAIQWVQVVALAALFAAGIFSWSRPEGSWALVIAACLGGLSLILGGGAALLQTIAQDSEFLSDVRIFSWQQVAGTCGFLAIGYFFLAYRGLAAPSPRRVVRRVRRRTPTSGRLPEEA